MSDSGPYSLNPADSCARNNSWLGGHESLAASAEAILNSSPRVNVAERRARYAEQGWTRFDETAAPYTAEQIAAERERYRVNRL